MSCGTERGVKAHKGRNEPPCKYCRKFMDGPTPTPLALVKPVRAPKQQKAMRDINFQPANVCGTNRGWQLHRKRHEDACHPCQGAHGQHLAEGRQARAAAAALLPPKERKTRAPRQPKASAVCGTISGRKRHYDEGTPVCETCRITYNEYSRAKYRETNPPKAPAVCGTDEGYGRHRWLRTTPCQPCLDAHAARTRASYHRKTEPLPPVECGTTRGERKHRKDGTPTCDPCRAAYNTYKSAQRAQRKKEAA